MNKLWRNSVCHSERSEKFWFKTQDFSPVSDLPLANGLSAQDGKEKAFCYRFNGICRGYYMSVTV